MNDKIQQEFGIILEPQLRLTNVKKMYSYLLTNPSNIHFEPMLKNLHRIGLEGWDLTQLRRYHTGGEESKKRLEVAQPGKYRDDAPNGYTSMEMSGYSYIAPSSEDIPELMSALSSKYETLVRQDCASKNAHLLATWAMTTLAILHPFYEGNGRIARVVLPYTLQRLKLMPQYVENLQKKTIDLKHNTFTDEIGILYQIGNVYKEQLEQDGILNVLSYAQSLPPTYERISDYWTKLRNAILLRINNMSWDVLLNSNHFLKAADVMKTMPFQLK